MGRKQRSANLLNNLPQLQNLIKRDPASYREEFKQQLQHFEASLAIFELKPDDEAKEFGELINFLSQVAKCYPRDCTQFPNKLINLLQKHYPVLNPDLRRSIVQALILLRSRRVVSNMKVMPLFFTLFRCRDKPLRELLYKHIVNDVKLANKGKHRNHKLNKALQGFMYTMITSVDAQDKLGEGAIAAKKSLDVCVELYRKGIWTDAKAVNVIAQACFSPITKVMMTAVQFFLNPIKKKSKDDDDSDDDGDVDNSTASRKYVPLSMVQHQSNVTKKTKYRKRKLERIEREYKREQAKRTGAYYDDEAEDDKKKNKKKLPVVNFEAISLIHDPQGFTEKLFGKVHAATTATKRGGSTVDRFEVRLAILKLVSRMINHHQLQLMAFYPFFQRYLQPHQTEVTQILAILATACHPFTPPDVLQPLIRATADNFVADHCAPEVMCAGLNTIRAIASRQPLAVDADLLNDLIMYRKHKDKGVMMAARSLLALYRSVNPEMLNRKDRGRDASMEEGVNIMAAFGEARPAEGVEGAELLDMYENPESEDENESDVEQEAGWEQFEAATDSEAEDEEGGEDGEGWTNADEDEDAEIEVESSDEEAEGEGEEVDEGDSDEEAEEADEEEFEEEVVPAKTETKRPRIEMTRFLTNEDFDRIEKLKRRQKKGTLTAPKRVKTDDYSDDDDEEDLQLSDSSSSSDSDSENNDYVDNVDILGDYHTRKRRRKASYEERTATILAGREGREKFSSSKAKRDRDGRSLSNKEKRKTKDYRMISHKRGVVKKGRRSLIEKRRDLRKHIVKQKKKGF